MPEIQAVLIGILREVVAICDAGGIPYCLVGGGCLGLVRHDGGFVPWDDDLDLAVWASDMPRFVAAMAALPAHLAMRVKSDQTNPSYMVMDMRTRTVDSGFEGAGVFIDIMPMMLWRSARWKAFDRTLDRVRRLGWNAGSPPARNAVKRALRLARVPGAAAWLAERCFYPLFRRQDRAGRRSGRGVVTAAYRQIWPGLYDYRTVFPVQTARFCGVAVSAPRDLHRYLSRRYGPDYMQPPPEEARWRHFSGALRIAEG
ncbi:MAG: LicD family protein [Bauldia sp.]|nr:LicD family protein [Bauldia sp.]